MWCCGTTLIAITGYGEEQALRRSREAGFDHYLVKPVNYDTLVDILIRASQRPDGNGNGHA
jgi:CheY-like chemotaxis protein